MLKFFFSKIKKKILNLIYLFNLYEIFFVVFLKKFRKYVWKFILTFYWFFFSKIRVKCFFYTVEFFYKIVIFLNIFLKIFFKSFFFYFLNFLKIWLFFSIICLKIVQKQFEIFFELSLKNFPKMFRFFFSKIRKKF